MMLLLVVAGESGSCVFVRGWGWDTNESVNRWDGGGHHRTRCYITEPARSRPYIHRPLHGQVAEVDDQRRGEVQHVAEEVAQVEDVGEANPVAGAVGETDRDARGSWAQGIVDTGGTTDGTHRYAMSMATPRRRAVSCGRPPPPCVAQSG